MRQTRNALRVLSESIGGRHVVLNSPLTPAQSGLMPARKRARGKSELDALQPETNRNGFTDRSRGRRFDLPFVFARLLGLIRRQFIVRKGCMVSCRDQRPAGVVI